MDSKFCQSPSDFRPAIVSALPVKNFEFLAAYEGDMPLGDLQLPWKVEIAASCQTGNTDGILAIDHSSNGLGQRTAVVRKLDFNVWRRKLIIEATLRVDVCDAAGGVVLGFCNGRRQEHLSFFVDRIELRHAAISIPADLGREFFTCRLEVEGDDLLVYRNGAVVLDGRGKNRHPGHRPPGVEFGTITPDTAARSEWKSVKAFLGQPVRQSGTQLHPARHLTIYKKKGVFPLFPHLIQTVDGHLQIDCVRRGSSSHMNIEGSKLLLTSEDEGETWHPTDEPLTNAARIGADDVQAYANAIGWRYSTDKELAAKLEAEGAELRWRDAEFAYAQGCFGARSLDKGKTWTTTPLPFPKAGILMHFHEAASLLRVDDQTILRAVYTKSGTALNRGYYEPYVLRSTDNGRTWKVIRIHSDPQKNLSLGETALVKAPNGDVLAMMRQEPTVVNASLWISRHLPLWISRSSDAGATWSPPEVTEIIGHPASLLCCRDGTLVCTYGFRPHPMGIRAATSKDNGLSWDRIGELILRSDGYGSPADNGYPITIEKKRGGLFTCYYLTDEEGVPYIAGSHWSL